MTYCNNSWHSNIVNIKQLSYIFPHLNDKKLYRKIMIDEPSLRYITVRKSADTITNIICNILSNLGINSNHVKLVDCTSGVGGNVLSFSNHFFEILAIEKNSLRASYLKNNIDIYKRKNIFVLNDSFMNVMQYDIINYSPNVIFIDFPWGDEWLKSSINYRITLDGKSAENILCEIFDKIILMYNPELLCNNYNHRLLVLKLPKNYDIEYLYNNTKLYENDYYVMKTHLYELFNMLMVVYVFYPK